jgi:hypothetical protein
MEKLQMKKRLVAAAALTLASFTVPHFMDQSLAAPGRSPFCDMEQTQRNPVAWNAYYHCHGIPAGEVYVAAPAPERHAHDPYCDMEKTQRNPVAWNAYYRCHGIPAGEASVAAPAPERHAHNPYCDMAKTQRNPVSWNAYYGCLAR